MHETELFEAFVWCVTIATACFWWFAEEARVAVFLGVCLAAQAAALFGFRAKSPALLRAAHAVFTLSMWIGTLSTRGRLLLMVTSLCGLSVASRRLLGHCMFDEACKQRMVDRPIFDLVYLFPFFLGASRLPSNFGEATFAG